MPKVNPARSTANEQNLARRIAHERQARNWKQATLARRVTELGCPMQGNTIFKIESGDPPRRVTVDELVAFARAFGLSPSELLVPMELVHDRNAQRLVEGIDSALAALADAVHSMVASKAELVRLWSKLADDDPLRERVQTFMPQRSVSYPMARDDEDEDTAPDPIWEAWRAMDAATTEYAMWLSEVEATNG